MNMESHVLLDPSQTYYIRKMLVFNTTLGLTLPKPFCNILGLENSSYVKIAFEKPNKIILQKLDPRIKEIKSDGN